MEYGNNRTIYENNEENEKNIFPIEPNEQPNQLNSGKEEESRNLQNDLGEWASRRNYDHDGVTELLGILNYHIEHNSISKNYRNVQKLF